MGESTAQGGGSSGGMGMSFSLDSMIAAGVDDIVGGVENMKKYAMANKLNAAQVDLLREQARVLKDKRSRDKKIRNLMLGYR
jgi:hypothetical protein